MLSDLPYDPLLRGKITIETVAWDKKGGPPMEATLTPQDAIRKGLPLPSQCDIFICLFWGRMGTPLIVEGKQYRSGTHYEYEEARAKSSLSGKPRILLYRRTTKIPLYHGDPGFDQELDQQRQLDAFFAEFKTPGTGQASGGYNSFDSPDEFRKKIEDHLKTIIRDVISSDERTYLSENNEGRGTGSEIEDYATKHEGKWEGSPFPGLRAFTEEDEPIFFGRGRETDRLTDLVRKSRFTAVVGASGSGKSSLVRAGMIPRIIRTAGDTNWQLIIFTPDLLGIGDPFRSAATGLYNFDNTFKIKTTTTALTKKPASLGSLLTESDSSRQNHFLIFVDQFEELFTTVNPNKRKGFVDLITKNIGHHNLSFIVTLRGDFYGQALEYPELALLLENGTFPLAAPGIPALQEMITRPAYRADLRFEADLPEQILEDTGNEPGALALMAYTLDELHRTSGGDNLLTIDKYRLLGGVKGAIGKRAESVFSQLDDEKKAELPYVFRELVEVDERGTATRRREKLTKVCQTVASKELVSKLTDARLLVQSRGDGNQPFVEVAHEALLRSWERLATWIDDTQDDLRLLRQVQQAANEWMANGRNDAFLWPHERLEPVYRMQKNLKVDFEKVVVDFTAPETERLALELNSKSTSTPRKQTIIDRFVEIGVPLQTMVDILNQSHPDPVKKRVVIALGKMKDDQAVPVLIQTIEGLKRISGVQIQESATTALGNFRSRIAMDALLKILRERPYLAGKAATALGRIGNKEVVPHLIEILGRNDDAIDQWDNTRVREAAIKALGKLKDERSIDVLIAMLSAQCEDDGKYRPIEGVICSAALALGDMKAAKAIPELKELLTKGHIYNGPASARRALMKIGTAEAQAAIGGQRKFHL